MPDRRTTEPSTNAKELEDKEEDEGDRETLRKDDFGDPDAEPLEFSGTTETEIDSNSPEPVSVTFEYPPMSLADNVSIPTISATEPLSSGFFLENAVRSLDATSLGWQKNRQCLACHTNVSYLPARALLSTVGPALDEVRTFALGYVRTKWTHDAYVVPIAFALAFSDAFHKKTSTEEVKEVLDQMWVVQEADGGFAWFELNKPPAESDEHYGVTLAAIATGVTPGYKTQPQAIAGLVKIRSYLESNPPTNLHHKTMLLWADSYGLDLLSPTLKTQYIEELRAVQRQDGGFSLKDLWKGTAESHSSDGYATGLVLYVLSLNQIEKDDGIERALDWLTKNQRESGRWFTPSVNSGPNYLSNIGTAYALMGLSAYINFEITWP